MYKKWMLNPIERADHRLRHNAPKIEETDGADEQMILDGKYHLHIKDNYNWTTKYGWSKWKKNVDKSTK